MLIHDHILIAAWIGAWTKHRVRQCYKALKTDFTKSQDESNNTRHQSDRVLQLQRHGHRQLQSWKRLHQAQRPDVIVQKVKLQDGGIVGTVEKKGVGDRDLERIRDDILEREAAHNEEKRNVDSALASERESPEATNEHQNEPSQTSEATLENVQFHGLDDLQSCSQIQLQVNGEASVEHLQPSAPACTADESKAADPRHRDILSQISEVTSEKVQVQGLDKSRSCSQLQPEFDSPHTAEESHSTVLTCTEDVRKATDPPMGVLLSTVNFTDSPGFAAWMPCEEPDEQHMSLSNITFRGCKQSGLELKSSCDFTNVTFVDCKFDHTIFLDVTLSDVTFAHVDFTHATFYRLVLRNVTITKLHFENDLWISIQLENALVSKHSFTLQRGSRRDCGLWTPAVSSKTKLSHDRDVPSPDSIKQEVCHDGSWKRDIRLRFAAPTGDILTRLAKHEEIIDRIMKYCFPGSSVHIHEYPGGITIPRSHELAKGHDPRARVPPRHRGQQYQYQVVDANCVDHRTMKHLTTYFGSMSSHTGKVSDVPANLPRRGTGGCTGLLRVNRAISKQGLNYLYGRTLHLQCNPVGAKEFLITHRDQMKLVKQLVLYFHWDYDHVVIRSETEEKHPWRHLHNAIRHELSYIPAIRLHVGQYFWKRFRWTGGATDNITASEDSPFSSLTKIAAPEDRWRYADQPSTHRTDGRRYSLKTRKAKNGRSSCKV